MLHSKFKHLSLNFLIDTNYSIFSYTSFNKYTKSSFKYKSASLYFFNFEIRVQAKRILKIFINVNKIIFNYFRDDVKTVHKIFVY